MAQEFDFVEGLRSGIQALGLPLLEEKAEQRLLIYFQELKHWSRKINLIAKGATDTEILEKHFLDSLTVLPLLEGDGSHLLDIGSGAGFPGLVCQAADPALQVTLVEPRLKRVSFLRHLARTLELANLTILACRVEDQAMLPAESHFSHITSRAVTDIKTFLDMSSRFARPGVQVICMKGPKWEEELAAWEERAVPGQFTLLSRAEYVLPISRGIRNLLLFQPV